jgi:hypothetical protein
MARNDTEKAAKILKKRRLAAKGLRERGDGKPIDPLEDIGEPDAEPNLPESQEEKQVRLARAAVIGSAGFRR